MNAKKENSLKADEIFLQKKKILQRKEPDKILKTEKYRDRYYEAIVIFLERKKNFFRVNAFN